MQCPSWEREPPADAGFGDARVASLASAAARVPVVQRERLLPPWAFGLTLVLLGALAVPVRAQGRGAAVARPLSGIVIDGDLSDWPDAMPRQPMDERSGAATASDADLRSSFRVGYSPSQGALYVAVEIVDESAMVDSTGSPLTPQDACLVSATIGHDLAQVWCGGAGTGQTDQSALDPMGRAVPGSRVAVRRTADGYQYELKLDRGATALQGDGDRPPPIRRLGLVTTDVDADGSASVAGWGKVSAAGFDRYGALGSLVLLGPAELSGRLRGEVLWPDLAAGGRLGRVWVTGALPDTKRVELRSDAQGGFDTELPAGRYQAVAAYGRGKSRECQVTVRPGETSTIQLPMTAMPPLGHVVDVRVQAVEADLGRLSSWQTFGQPEARALSNTTAILQDSQGYLWFASTGQGLARHDGQTFGTYDQADGLGGGQITFVQEDSAGILWVGTRDGGVSRGAVVRGRVRFTALTVRDGLASNHVGAMRQGRSGDLWLVAGVSETNGGRSVQVVTDGLGLSRFTAGIRPTLRTTLTPRDGLPRDLRPVMIEDRAGVLWLATEHGVCRYDGKAFVTSMATDGVPDGRVSHLWEDEAGVVWLVSQVSELALGRPGVAPQTIVTRYEGGRFARALALQGSYRAILRRRDGTLWLAGEASGSGGWPRPQLVRFDGTRSTVFAPNQVPSVGMPWYDAILLTEDDESRLWIAGAGGVTCFDHGRFTGYGVADRLPDKTVTAMLPDREGNLWFGTQEGVARCDRFVELGSEALFEGGKGWGGVSSITQDRNGRLWFGSGGFGSSRYDGEKLLQVGQPPNGAYASYVDHRGDVWFGTGTIGGFPGHKEGTPGLGVYRFDGASMVEYDTDDGLPHQTVTAFAADSSGSLWIGTLGGLARWDGTGFQAFTTSDGLTDNAVLSLALDRDGKLWIGTFAGLTVYDGQRFTPFACPGWAPRPVWAIVQDSSGVLWLGLSGGVCRYDGAALKTYTTRDGLAHEVVLCILADRQGVLWFGTAGGGLSRFDGLVFQNLTERDGLGSNWINDLHEDRDGYVWIATPKGVTRYRPMPSAPPITTEVPFSEAPRTGTLWMEVDGKFHVPSSYSLVGFRFGSMSLKTPPQQMAYVYRLTGYETEWRQTRARQVEYADLPRGNYTFEVKAVDRDLIASATPARIALEVYYPMGEAALKGGAAAALGGLVLALGYAVRQRQRRYRAQEETLAAQHRLMEALEQELRTAHELQMGLLPKGSPAVEGCSAAGRCLPAAQVGGDLFQYYHAPGRLSVALADVTGHAMQAAIPAVMFSGILDSQMQAGREVGELLTRLNQALCERLTGHTHVAFTMAEIGVGERRLRLANAGCPFPLHYRTSAGQAVEVEAVGYPLGVRSATVYGTVEVELGVGDYVVVYSDGVPEAAGPGGELFGFERTVATVRQACTQGLSPEAVIDHLMAAMRGFCGETAQGDDITCVVVRMEG